MCHSPTESYLNFTLRVEGVHLPTTGCFLLDAVGADGLWIEPLDLVVLLLPAEHPVTGVPPRPHRQGGVEEKLGLPVRLASPEAGRARVSGLGQTRTGAAHGVSASAQRSVRREGFLQFLVF